MICTYICNSDLAIVLHQYINSTEYKDISNIGDSIENRYISNLLANSNHLDSIVLLANF